MESGEEGRKEPHIFDTCILGLKLGFLLLRSVRFLSPLIHFPITLFFPLIFTSYYATLVPVHPVLAPIHDTHINCECWSLEANSSLSLVNMCCSSHGRESKGTFYHVPINTLSISLSMDLFLLRIHPHATCLTP